MSLSPKPSTRLLGVGPDDEQIIDGRAFIKKHGGAVTCPSWAKFWLSLLGDYDPKMRPARQKWGCCHVPLLRQVLAAHPKSKLQKP